ncbi:hypothetical protein W97_07697 [Coniosporium apollinis CBS 100218]|uniref:UTP--glucose-1-phosphate uridylyltransferase n=1 Tax=Coniosporium apollinis (strain CBS 100218) TaxID=1168221 RepID=R7Z2V0_CONA1|nr:uncharacterized protein W97_07697 [Coniosporium apollinis CBS 100218]EON68487.1 hypothetical protein W97_07697 [Coniosporium apollinis CBS 100218]
MAARVKDALPSHLKPSAAGNGDSDGFARKHHGKTQSHVTSGRLFAAQRLGFDVSIDEAILADERALHHYAAGAPFPAKPEIRRSPAIRESNIPARQFCVHRSGNIDVLYYDGTTDLVSEDEQNSHHSHPGMFDCRSCSPRAFSFDEPQQQGSVILYGGTLDTPEAASDAGLDIPERLSDEDVKAEVLALLDGQPGPATWHSNDARTAQSYLAGQCEEQLLDSMDVDSQKAFENTQTSVAASQMRNALNNLCDTVKDPEEKKRFETEMDNFFALFRRYLNDKAKGNAIEWSRIAPPKPEQVINYNDLPASENIDFLNKLAVVKLNGGLGTSMGCVGPKSVIEVRDGMSFLDLSVRQIEYLNRTYDVNVPFVLMNSFNTDADTASIIKKYEGHNIDIMTFNQSKYPRILKDSLLPAPKSADSDIANWYPPGHGDVFESMYNSGILDKLIDRGIEIIFLSNADNLGAVVDLRILQHMVDSKAEYIMELTDKTKADVKGGTIIDYEGQARLLEIAQVPKEHVNEFKSIKKFKYFNTNNIWMNLKAVKRVVENNELAMEIIPNGKSIPADKKGEADLSVLQLETAVGAAIRHFHGAHGVNVPRRRFLPVKTCSDLMLVKSDLYTLQHGQLMMDPNRFGPAPLIKLGSDFKKVSSFQARIPSIPKIVELDHLTITGAVNLGRGVTMKGTVIIVATEGSTIDIPPGSILENVVVQGSLRLLEH